MSEFHITVVRRIHIVSISHGLDVLHEMFLAEVLFWKRRCMDVCYVCYVFYMLKSTAIPRSG